MKLRLFYLILMSMLTLSVSAQVTTHIVDRGETLESIAKKYGTTKDAILQLNPDAVQFIYVGMELSIPEGANQVTQQNTVNQANTDSNLLSNNSDQAKTKYSQVVQTEEDDSHGPWGGFFLLGPGFISHKTEQGASEYEKNKINCTSWDITIGATYEFYHNAKDHIAKAFLGVGYRNTTASNFYMNVGTYSDNEVNYYYIKVPVGLTYTFGSNEKLGISPMISLESNIGVKSKAKKSGYQEEEKKIKLKKPKTCFDFQVGVNVHLWDLTIFGAYNFPIGDNAKNAFGKNGYPLFGVGIWF